MHACIQSLSSEGGADPHDLVVTHDPTSVSLFAIYQFDGPAVSACCLCILPAGDTRSCMPSRRHLSLKGLDEEVQKGACKGLSLRCIICLYPFTYITCQSILSCPVSIEAVDTLTASSKGMINISKACFLLCHANNDRHCSHCAPC